ncbi:hypothetical protein [Klebsiella pneumoniae]|uniref:hypothetical protein n=1 Tax=Klebsiella pneumoniae TaxID=573 RepID=UPI000B6C0AE0|nr:hypothetical protein [Klebsiella pneumoniae]OVG36148.1 hypothetical protein B5M05_19615 [Klebsiella pneumoniae]
MRQQQDEPGRFSICSRQAAVVQATTGKRAIKAFIERCEPVKGWFLGAPEDITDQVKKEEEEAGSKPQV